MSIHETSQVNPYPEAWESIKETVSLLEEYHRTLPENRSAKFTEAVYLRLRFADPILVVGRGTKSTYHTTPDGGVVETKHPMPN